MKFRISLVIFLSLIFSCTTELNNSITPLWFGDNFNKFNDKEIYFKAEAYSEEDALKVISESSKDISLFVKPLKDRDYFNGNKYFLLYKVNITDLESEIITYLNRTLSDIKKVILDGDKAIDPLEKISFYQKALKINNSTIEEVKTIVIKYNLDIEIDNMELLIESKLSEAHKLLVLNVNIKNDFNDSVKKYIEDDLHRSGYETSDSGLVYITGELTITDAQLNNNYLNKYWTLTINLEDLLGNVKESFTINGRASQISELSLNQTIIRDIKSDLRDNLSKLIDNLTY